MTGTGLSIITEDNKDSYNTAVNTINRHQKDNVLKLQSALNNASYNNTTLQAAVAELSSTMQQLKKQVFINQALIDNWESTAPYSYPVDLLV